MRSFWAVHRLTGDNSKERPYATIYPHLTTRSNTFEVHLIVQTLIKGADSPVDAFDPVKDAISGEWRTSAFLETRIDPNTPAIPDYASKAASAEGLSPGELLDDFRETSVVRINDESSDIPIELTGFEIEPGVAVTVRWRSRYGQRCEVQGSTDLTAWTPLMAATTGMARTGTVPASPAPASPEEGAVTVPLPRVDPPDGDGAYFVRVQIADPPP
jgi:hypothetical protein